MALTDFLCLITEIIIAIPVIDANIPGSKYCHQAAMDNHILFCFIVLFYVLFKISHHLHEADIHIWYR